MKFDPNYPPIKHIDGLESERNHSMVLYENEEYGKLVINRFIENGLKKGENSVCFTHGDVQLVENELEEYGIDVDLFKRKKLLHVIHIKNIMGNEEELEQRFDKLLRPIINELNPLVRFTASEPTVSDISTPQGILSELIIEEFFQSHFGKYNCSFLCPYSIKEIESTNRSKWIKFLMKHHHNLIYAADPQNSVSFETDLIQPLSN